MDDVPLGQVDLLWWNGCVNRSGKSSGTQRHTGPVIDRVRALRARELHHSSDQAESGSPEAPAQMPAPGQEWEVILADLRRRAEGDSTSTD
ncbi:hypothetical protein A8L58_06235 [Acidipropionibacterium acidipropionici]|jgi:hypothetical protein|uniref:Uncharacterized protein n=1 Tax=Acidipropionibacterium acidipropionici TaxID=1748 RepID=A0ABM6FPL0_9ACTN|nr:hypothetical protein A8L58_06235 [Acidipropionibacterium acidipropionici]APZ10736.1 hypothetical protein BWX38_04435 [Acidipropionibacterium acidipropionici]